MSKAYMRIWVQKVGDGADYDNVSSDKEGITFSVQDSESPFSFDNSELDDDLFEPSLSLFLHDEVRIANLPESSTDGAVGEIELPDITLRTHIGDHTQKTKWCTVTYRVDRDTSVDYPCFMTTVLNVTLPNGKITMSRG